MKIDEQMVMETAAQKADELWLSAVSHGTAEQRINQCEMLKRMGAMLMANAIAQEIWNYTQNEQGKTEKEVIEEVLGGNMQALLDMTMETYKGICEGKFERTEFPNPNNVN